MPFADIGGIELFYEIQGNGEPVVLLHHGFGCTKMWHDIIPSVTENGYKAVCFDRRGFGQSSLGKDFEGFYVSDTFRSASVNELEAFRDWLGIDSFHLVGQCEGGVVAVDYAARYPGRVKTIVMSSTLCYSSQSMTDFNASKFTKSFQELDPGLQHKLLEWHGERTEEFFNQFRQFGGAYGKDVFDLRPVLPTVQCPTLVLYPDRSFLFEVEQGVALYRHLPTAELAVLPDCGHNTYDDHPEEYAAHVCSFLNRHRFGETMRSAAKAARPITCAG
jgi:3-oxoadipate enol-lactonase